MAGPGESRGNNDLKAVNVFVGLPFEVTGEKRKGAIAFQRIQSEKHAFKFHVSEPDLGAFRTASGRPIIAPKRTLTTH